jgi:protein PhnA
MSDLPNCPECKSEYTYIDGLNYVCPECAHEWSKDAVESGDDDARVIKDANGNILQDGDHAIDCKIDGIGAMKLKSQFVKKA